jgi:hypothetical protein
MRWRPRVIQCGSKGLDYGAGRKAADPATERRKTRSRFRKEIRPVISKLHLKGALAQAPHGLRAWFISCAALWRPDNHENPHGSLALFSCFA